MNAAVIGEFGVNNSAEHTSSLDKTSRSTLFGGLRLNCRRSETHDRPKSSLSHRCMLLQGGLNPFVLVRIIYGILPSGFRSDPGPQASHGGPSRRPRCPTHTQPPTLSCGMCLQVPPGCSTTPLQRHLTNVLLLQASTFSRSGKFGCGHLLAHMPPHQTMLPHTAPIPLIDNLASLRLILRRSRTGADFLPPHGGTQEHRLLDNDSRRPVRGLYAPPAAHLAHTAPAAPSEVSQPLPAATMSTSGRSADPRPMHHSRTPTSLPPRHCSDRIFPLVPS